MSETTEIYIAIETLFEQLDDSQKANFARRVFYKGKDNPRTQSLLRHHPVHSKLLQDYNGLKTVWKELWTSNEILRKNFDRVCEQRDKLQNQIVP